MNDMQSLQLIIGSWGERTFPKATFMSIIKHMRREVVELENSATKDNAGEECADIFCMLLHIAHRYHFDLYAETQKKMDINYKRTWGEPDADGVVEHVREGVLPGAAGNAGKQLQTETANCVDCADREKRTTAHLNKTKHEYVICAAVHYDDGISYEHQPKNVATGIVVAGRRHHNAIMTVHILADMSLEKAKKFRAMKQIQGFITSRDRFLNRQEAWLLAVEVGQIETDVKEGTMFSEDLY